MKEQGIYLREMKAEATEATIDIIGIIGWEVWYPALRDMLRNIPDTVERVVFDIYSPGGSVWDGNGIVQEIGKLTQHTVARVQVAASMATLIAVACDERTMSSNGRFLIHNAWTCTEGDAAAHEKRAQELRDCELEAAAFYAKRTGKTEAEVIALMNEERWLTPAEAQEWGFVAEIDDPFDVSAFAGVRDAIKAEGKWPVALADIPTQEEGETDNDATSAGAKDEGGGTGEGGGKPNVPEPEEITEARRLGFTEGQEAADEGLRAQVMQSAESVLALTGERDELQEQLTAKDVEARKLQGERDQARAAVEKSKTSLDEATAKIVRLTAGGLTFAPEVETWEQAMAISGKDYTKARRDYPDAYEAQRKLDKENRK